MMRRALRFVLLLIACAMATFVGGWWGLVVVGVAWGLLNPGERWTGVFAGVSGGASWILILAWTSTQGPVGAVANKAAAVMGFSPVVLYVATVFFGALACGSAAGLVASLGRGRAATGVSAG
ncbi:MAG TPA: hypothetical protein VGI83_04490 [Gemmatimonadales bacterium]|jgi:hypothetical protein